jgi:hypothetical protein
LHEISGEVEMRKRRRAGRREGEKDDGERQNFLEKTRY